MYIFYSDVHLQHNPAFEIFDGGEKVPNFESPERAERILKTLKQKSWAEIHSPTDFGMEPILEVHDADYITFLQNSFAEWMQTETETNFSKSALLPATFPAGKWRHKPVSLLGKAGYYIQDLSAPIVEGTFAAAIAAANCALSGANAILTNQKSSFALCRPPGHHAGKASCAGYCYINNAAVAANFLSKRGKTAILDIDYHAGNGTQDIFYDRCDVLTISIHDDPGHAYPYFAGYPEETGEGIGFGFHQNYPLFDGTNDDQYLETLQMAVEKIIAFDPAYLVISAGMDLYCGDPLGKFNITTDGINRIGKEISNLGKPTLVIMEGGYNNDALGTNITTFLENFV